MEIETGLIVNLKNSNIYSVSAFIDNSEFYGYEIESGIYLFPSPESEFNVLEKALTYEFNRWNINLFTFE